MIDDGWMDGWMVIRLRGACWAQRSLLGPSGPAGPEGPTGPSDDAACCCWMMDACMHACMHACMVIRLRRGLLGPEGPAGPLWACRARGPTGPSDDGDG